MHHTISNPIIQSQTPDTLHFSVGCLDYLKESLRHFSFEESSEDAQCGITRLIDCVSHALTVEEQESRDDGNSSLNPLIQPHTNETLQYCTESLAYIKEAIDNAFGISGFSQTVQLGMYTYIECVQQALEFEQRRAQADDAKAIKQKVTILEQALKNTNGESSGNTNLLTFP